MTKELPVSTLIDYDGEQILGSFYENELVKVYVSDVYKVEKVLQNRERQVLVCWLGWPSKYDSWIPLRFKKV